MANRRVWQPIFTPFLALVPIIIGAIYLYNSDQAYFTCDVSTQGEFCGTGSSVAAISLITIGVLFAAITGIFVAIKYRKKIIWLNWGLLWMLFIVVAVSAVTISNRHTNNYAKQAATPYYMPPSGQ